MYIYLFIHLLSAVLGVCCCTGAFSGCSEQGLLLVAVLEFLTTVPFLVTELEIYLDHTGVSSCGTQA